MISFAAFAALQGTCEQRAGINTPVFHMHICIHAQWNLLLVLFSDTLLYGEYPEYHSFYLCTKLVT